MAAGFGITIWLIVIIWWTSKLVCIYRERQAYKNREPDDRGCWGVDQWAAFYLDSNE